MSKLGLLIVAMLILNSSPSQAQFSASKDAQYIATLKAVVNYKINDKDLERDIKDLRANKTFTTKLQKMLDKLDNGRTQDSTNRKVMKVLEKAGEEIYKILD